jgi:hypothetical protein
VNSHSVFTKSTELSFVVDATSRPGLAWCGGSTPQEVGLASWSFWGELPKRLLNTVL